MDPEIRAARALVASAAGQLQVALSLLARLADSEEEPEAPETPKRPRFLGDDEPEDPET